MRAITNGVHMPTWLSNEMSKLFDAYLPKHAKDKAPTFSRTV